MNPRLKLLLVGDVMIGRVVNEVLKTESPSFPWGDTLALFHQVDFRGCNLECVISDRGKPWCETSKAFHFRTAAKNIEALKAARIDAVSLANNHTLDFSHGAMRDMLRILDRAGIAHSGAGGNLRTAATPAIINVKGVRIGWLSFTDNQPEWEAGARTGGVVYVPMSVRDERAVRLFEMIRQTRRCVDLLIVAAHWGGNWGYSPPTEHVEFGRALVIAGADVVFGHSAHVFRGIEIYEGRPIIYSAGDFIDDYAVNPEERNDQSFIFVLETEGRNLRRLRQHPTVIRNCQARLAQGAQAYEIVAMMVKLCRALNAAPVWNSAEQCLEITI